jgi:lipoprotein NlpI
MRTALVFLLAAAARGESAREVYAKAVEDFRNGRIMESAGGFDRLAKMAPRDAPHLWQRGIALYYAGRWADCRAQFESHRTVNPNDVENAAWHFLCVAKAEGMAKARAALLPVGPDGRVPMREVYGMFQGRLTAEQVLEKAGEEPEGQFYGHLYVGLYCEAAGKTECAREHIRKAAEERYSAGGYMHMVAVVHSNVRGWK